MSYLSREGDGLGERFKRIISLLEKEDYKSFWFVLGYHGEITVLFHFYRLVLGFTIF
jgi:hypothetical protein